MSHHSYKPFIHGTEKDSHRGTHQPGTESYPSGFGHHSGSVGGLGTLLTCHSQSNPGQETNDNLQMPFNQLAFGGREDTRLHVNHMSHSTEQLTYGTELASSNKGIASTTWFTGHSQTQSKSVNVSASSPAAMTGGFGVAKEDQSILGLGPEDHPRHTPGDAPETSQPKYTFEAASNILQQFGLEMDDLEPLLSFPEDQVTPANLPFILRKIRTSKEKATSLTAGIEKKPLPQKQASKVIDYGHTSKYVEGMGESSGRYTDGANDGGESVCKADGGFGQRSQKDRKADLTKHSLSVLNSYSQPKPYSGYHKSLPKTVVSRVVPDVKPSTSATFKDIPSRSQPKPLSHEKPSKSSGLACHPSRSDVMSIESKGPSNKSATTYPYMGMVGSKPAKTPAPQKTRMPVNPGSQPHLTLHIPPGMQTAQNMYIQVGSLSEPALDLVGPRQTTANQPFMSESTYKGSAVPHMMTANMHGAIIPPTNQVSAFKETVYKGLPTAAMMHDYAATTPRVFPHTCSLCYKHFAQMKEWADHQNSALHLENCKRLRKEYPQWDGSVTRALSDERKNLPLKSTSKKTHGSSASLKRQSPHRRSTKKQGRSRSRSSSPRTSGYTRKWSHENRISPTKHHGSSRDHGSLSPRRTTDRWVSPPRYRGSASPRRNQEDWYRASKRHSSSSPSRTLDKWLPSGKRTENVLHQRQTRRSPTEKRVLPRESKEKSHPLKKKSKERQAPPLKGSNKQLPPLKGTKKDVSQRGSKETSSTFECHESNKSLKPNKTPAPGVKKTAEKLAKSVLGSSALQSLPKHCDVEAVVKSLTPVILAEWGKLMISSSTNETASSSATTLASLSAAKKKPGKTKHLVSTSEAGKITPPTMVKLSGIQPCITHNDVLTAVEEYGRTKSVLLIRSRREAVVCFEKEEDARKVKALEIKGFTVTPKPKETLKKEPKKSLAKKIVVTKLSSAKIAQSCRAGMRKGVKITRKTTASRVNPLLSKAKALLTSGTLKKRAQLKMKQKTVKLAEIQTEVINLQHVMSPEKLDDGVKPLTDGESSDQTGAVIVDSAAIDTDTGAEEKMEVDATHIQDHIPAKLIKEEDCGSNVSTDTVAPEDKSSTTEASLMTHEDSKETGEGEAVLKERGTATKVTLSLNPVEFDNKSDVGECGQTLLSEQVDIGAESQVRSQSPNKTAGVVNDLTADSFSEGKGAEEEIEVDAPITIQVEKEETTQETHSTVGSPAEDQVAESKCTGDPIASPNHITMVGGLNSEHSGEVDSTCGGQMIQEDRVAVAETQTDEGHSEKALPHKKSESDFKKEEGNSSRTVAANIIIDLTIDEPDELSPTFTVESKQASPNGTSAAAALVRRGHTAINSTSGKETIKETHSCESVWKRATWTQIFHMTETLKMSQRIKLKGFCNLDLCNILVSKLPHRAKPDVQLVNSLKNALKHYAPPGWEPDFYYIMEFGLVFVAFPAGRCAHDIVYRPTWTYFQRRKIHYHILNSNVASSPLTFFQTVMEFIDEAAEVDGSKTVFFGRISTEEVVHLQKGFKDTQSVQNFMPLCGKLFIQFSTLEDADQFGLQLSQKNQPIGRQIYRLGLTPAEGSSSQFLVDGADVHLFNPSIPEGSHSPFWLPISSFPYLYPTARPTFVIPAHRTIRDIADIQDIVSKGGCDSFKTVMFTKLPQECNAQLAIKKRIQPHLKNVTPEFDDYRIIVLPLQRRAFVHFDDWESCCSCLRDFARMPIHIGKNKLGLHLVTESMCSSYSEVAMYQSLMELSNTPVQNSQSLSKRLLVVAIPSYQRKRVGQLLHKASSVGPIVHFLPLDNWVFIEMVNSGDATELWPIFNVERCEDIQRHQKEMRKFPTEDRDGACCPPSCQDPDVTPPVKTPAGASAESCISHERQESESDIAVTSDVIVIDEAQENEDQIEAGSTAGTDLGSSSKTTVALQSSCAPAIPNMNQMFLTLKAAIREHRLAKISHLEAQKIEATDESGEIQSGSAGFHSEGLVIIDEVGDSKMNLTSSVESRAATTTDERRLIVARSSEDKTESHSSANDVDSVKTAGESPLTDCHLQREAESDDFSGDQQAEDELLVNRDDTCVSADIHSNQEEDDFENFEILDEFECQMAEEMADTNQDEKQETNCSERRDERPSQHVSNNEADQEENGSFQILDSIYEDNVVEGPEEDSSESKLADLARVVNDLKAEDGHTSKSLNADSCNTPEDAEHHCGVNSLGDQSTADLSVINDVNPEAFQILDSVDDQSENEEEPMGDFDSTQLREDTDALRDEVEYEVIDCVDDQPTASTAEEGETTCISDTTSTVDLLAAADTKRELQKAVMEKQYEIVDRVDGDQANSDIEKSRGSSRIHDMERNSPGGADRLKQSDKCDKTRVVDSTGEESAGTGLTYKTRSGRSKRGRSNEVESLHIERMTTRRSRSLVHKAASFRRNTSSANEVLNSLEDEVMDEIPAQGRRRQPRSLITVDQHDDNVVYQILDSVGEGMNTLPPTDDTSQVPDAVIGDIKTEDTFSSTSLETCNEVLEMATNEDGIYQVLDSCDDEPLKPLSTESGVAAKNEEAFKAEKESDYEILDCLEVAQEHQVSSDSSKGEGDSHRPMDSPRRKESLEVSLDGENISDSDIANNNDVKRSEFNSGPQESKMGSCVNFVKLPSTSILGHLEDVSEDEEDSFCDTSKDEEKKNKQNLSSDSDETPVRVNERNKCLAKEDVVKRRRSTRLSQMGRENVVIDTSEMVTVDEVTDDAPEEKNGGVMEEDYLAMLTLDEITEEEEEVEEEATSGPEICSTLNEQDSGYLEKDKQSDNLDDLVNFVTVDEIHDDDNDLNKDPVTLRRSRRTKRVQSDSVTKSGHRKKVNVTEEETHSDQPEGGEADELQKVQMDVLVPDITQGSGASSLDSSLPPRHSVDPALRVAQKRKTEGGGPKVKKMCDFPEFTPNNPLGPEFVRPRSAFFCDLCCVFFPSESKAMKEHCSSRRHYDNLKNYSLNLENCDSQASRESSPR